MTGTRARTQASLIRAFKGLLAEGSALARGHCILRRVALFGHRDDPLKKRIRTQEAPLFPTGLKSRQGSPDSAVRVQPVLASA
jgi:hypothetical protein